jgi:SAM-dependent methyltransferase
VRRALKTAYARAADGLDLALGRRDPLTPPRRQFDLEPDFKETGDVFCRLFQELGNLKPTEQVLDVGCRIGRMAIPLTGYLRDGGSYEGFDIDRERIEWCSRNITSRFPHFRFRHADIYNQMYNPEGTIPPTEFVFPYPDASFDFVFLSSVFTHMLPDDVDHYLGEISRVLRPGGRVFVTLFLLNAKSQALQTAGKGSRRFEPAGEGYGAMVGEIAEAAVAYEEPFIRGLFARHHLPVREPVHYGTWCGRPAGASSHDIVIAARQ